MMREYPSGPILAVGAVVLDANRVLLVKRAQQPGKGTWSIPGGVVGLGETLDQALRREILEETGLLVQPLELVGVAERILMEAERVQYHYVILDYLCLVQGGALQASSDAEQARWFHLEEIASLGLNAQALEIIQKARRLAQIGEGF
ncbi:MAG: NUDIX hydrolase [bacterium]